MGGTIILLQLILSHLVVDFFLQPKKWVDSKNTDHIGSTYLYIHGALAGMFAYLFTSCEYLWAGVIIFTTHTLIDLAKSYKKGVRWFVFDQLLHLIVLIFCWIHFTDATVDSDEINSVFNSDDFWILLTAGVILTMPAGILIQQWTERWSNTIQQSATNSADSNTGSTTLQEGGKWIGITERLIIFVFVLNEQYEAIGLLVAAKSILRFRDDDRTEAKTEYLLLGSLLSIGLAIAVGIGVKILID